ncbi:MAG: DUF2304 domain-containing protein [Erysipelotrichaceae bacterium]|nr:DUF2304 domain-containing protein [Erysipelotrichaceae bacterium]
MNRTLQIFLFTFSLLSLVMILRSVYRNKMNIHFAMIWIVFGIVLTVISIFPKLISYLSMIMGIYAPANTIFLVTIFFLYALSFYAYLRISKLSDQVQSLNYEIALLKKKLEERNKE